MGCDIHLVVQIKEKDSEYWFTQARFRANRWYTMFAYMNREVRNYEDVLGFEERGIPEGTWYKPDAEDTYQDLGDHSYSWLTTDEFEEAINQTYRIEKYNNVIDYKGILQFMRHHEHYGAQARLIFGFDS